MAIGNPVLPPDRLRKPRPRRDLVVQQIVADEGALALLGPDLPTSDQAVDRPADRVAVDAEPSREIGLGR